MPRAKNAVYGFSPGDSTDTAYVQRYIRGDAEIKDIREKGYAVPKEGGKQKKYWTADYRDWETDRKSTRLNSSHSAKSRMPSSA